MTRDEIVRIMSAFGPILLLAAGVWIYHLRYLRQIERDRADDAADDGRGDQAPPPVPSRSTR